MATAQRGAARLGKQSQVQSGAFLNFLRSVGFRDELPPSTVAWLDSAPVFRFLAGRLSAANFVSAADAQEFNELMLARGPNADLYDALGSGSGHGSGSDDEADGGGSCCDGGQRDWLEAPDDGDDLEALEKRIEAKQAHLRGMEAQVASLRSLAGRLDGAADRCRRGAAAHVSAQARVAAELSAVHAETSTLEARLDDVMHSLEAACEDLLRLAHDEPERWLLCVADMSEYEQQDEAARQLFDRGMRLLNAAGVVRQLDPSVGVSPAPPLGRCASPAMSTANVGAGVPSALLTPRRQRQADDDQQQQQLLLLPRSGLLTPRGKSKRGDALLDADVRRHADQELRNAALLRELTRQRLAFKLALDDLIQAEVAEAGVKGQLAALQEVRACAGGYARLRRMGADSVGQLGAEVESLEERRQLLAATVLPELTEDLARLNDTHIIAGDYERQLHKMSLASQRKQAVLTALLGVASRHLLLLLLAGAERDRLAGLLEQLEGAADMLQGAAEAAAGRIHAYGAAVATRTHAAQRSNLAQDDSYALALLAAAQDQLPAAVPGDCAAVGDSVVASLTPAARKPAGAAASPPSARTPGYAPIVHLGSHLAALGSAAQQGHGRLQDALQELPQQLQGHRDTACALHDLAYPPGQAPCAPLMPGRASEQLRPPPSSTCGTSFCGSSAPPSVRSATSSAAGSGGGAGTAGLPALRVPEVAEAHAGLLDQVRRMSRRAAEMAGRLQECRALISSGRTQSAMERRIMVSFHTAPHELGALVASLRKEVASLEAAGGIGM